MFGVKFSYINYSFTLRNSYLPATATAVAVDGADVSTLIGDPPTLLLLATNKLQAGASWLGSCIFRELAKKKQLKWLC